ncbi:Translesion DNA polymerase - REV1 deoxycytidyl transferase [Handroanthus impetiginosus]|uniref:DNA repair protein REV1 n=1 Tax=Handroanthus impetiginosus TaxID=429701 RepID=A0A2G9HIG8_9LAMI|nr:Translesion DNA polymerase - REV1 deoxycytidyl transferase [Handroanthus impetiginosus]
MSSDSKSKRSFKSISSNPSSSSTNSRDGKNSNNKKKKTAQKTLGMAWGANSHSSSRSAFRNSPFSDFGSYMVVKNQKLHEQFDAAATSSSHSGSSSGKSIFCRVSIFVDGYTIPSSQELRGYMLKYGGRFENYFSRHRVTHIICSNLPDSKIKNLRAFSGGLPVVKPAWVLDSVAANKLLSWIPYQLDQLASENDNQPKLSAFFTPEKARVTDTENLLVDGQEISENDNQSFIKMDSSLSHDYASVEQQDRCSVKLDDLVQVNTDEVMSEGPACSVESSCEVKGVDLSDCSPIDGRDPDFKSKSSKCQASVSLCSNSMENHNTNEASSSRISLPPDKRPSTLGDPNFVENYFKSSRLHFIGTWRSRYRKRFPGMSSEYRYKSSSLNDAVANEKTAIIHMDMDCFFVSVVVRNRPELFGKPVAVCHSDSLRGTAEISSANYPARDHGVKAGMFVKDAKIRCPQLVVVPYDFGAYEKVADQFYDILHKHSNKVQAVSCDEAFLDVSESEVGDPQLLASIIRKEILDTTGCTASAGIAGNMLMARLATKTAKPDGQFYIPPEKVDDYLSTLPVKALPGIGYVLEAKLKRKLIKTCGQLRLLTKESLQKDFGMKTGEMLWNYSRGIDNRPVGVIQESKSIGAEVNWGVRFRNSDDVQHFLTSLCKEVGLRLQGCGVQGRSFTLKIKKKRSDAGEPVKYMGCGDCENLSHTITIAMATDDVDVLQRLATQLFGHFHIDVKDIRGVGLQVSKLEGVDDGKLVHKRNSILPWLVSTSTKATDCKQVGDLSNHGDAGGPSTVSGPGLSNSEISVAQSANLPPLQDLDVTVIESLPPEVFSEINDMYGGKLLGFISEHKSKTVSTSIINAESSKSCEDFGIAVGETEFPQAHLVEANVITGDNEELQYVEEAPAVLAMSASFAQKNLMPSSLSQVDCSVLQQLPDELRKDIIGFLPLHREQESVKGASSDVIDRQPELAAFELKDLWVGSPPKWVEMFKKSTYGTLNSFAMMYQSGSGGCLSSLLQHMTSGKFSPIEMGTDGFDDAVSWMCELFRQYIDIKISADIEEIYFCICLLRRLTGRSEFFLQVYNAILSHLQASFSEKYGGTLSIPLVKS